MIEKASLTEQWHRISPLSVVFFIGRFVRQAIMQALPSLAFIVAALASTGNIEKDWVLRGVFVIATIILGVAILSYLRFRYRITADRILLRSGVLQRDELNIEFSRVQNIIIKEPFYMRPFGLSVLNIDTAGSNAKEIQLAGVSLSLALKMRETILNGAATHTADADAEDKTSGEPSLLLELTRRDIVIYGLTANFMLWAAIAIGGFFSTGEFVETSLVWLSERYGLGNILNSLQNDGGTILVVAVILGLFLLVLLLLPLISVIGALLRYDGYRLTVEGETYRKSSGLLSKHDESIKQHKIQALLWKQNAIARLFKRINIQLRQASAGTGLESGQLPTGPKSTFLVPALHPLQAHDLSKEFLPDCHPENATFSRVSRRQYIKIYMTLSLLPVSLALLLPGLLVSWIFLTAVPILALITFPVVHQQWKKTGYGVVGEYGFIRKGFIGSQTTIFPLFKIQRVDIRQTPSQRRKQLAHLTIHLASHSVTLPYIPLSDALDIQNLALYKAESTRRSWY